MKTRPTHTKRIFKTLIWTSAVTVNRDCEVMNSDFLHTPIIGASDAGLSQYGRKVTVVSFTIGKYRVNGTINDKNLVELTDTWFPNPVYGDMDYEMRFTKYKDFGGVQFQQFGLHHVEVYLGDELRLRFPLPVIQVKQA